MDDSLLSRPTACLKGFYMVQAGMDGVSGLGAYDSPTHIACQLHIHIEPLGADTQFPSVEW
jgi:hypothetical protein